MRDGRAATAWRPGFQCLLTARSLRGAAYRAVITHFTGSVATVLVPHITTTLFAAALSGIVALTSHQPSGLAYPVVLGDMVSQMLAFSPSTSPWISEPLYAASAR